MRKPPRLEIKDSDDLFELSSFIDPLLGLKLDHDIYLSQVWIGTSKSESKKFDDFRKSDWLGKGFYASVYKVYHKPSKKNMAFKQVQFHANSLSLHQIQTEFYVLHSSTCPYIIDFYGAFFKDAKVFFCIELMDASIEALISNGIPESVLKLVIISVLRALNYLKDQLQIIHGDVKPGNILISKSGTVKICKSRSLKKGDFGVSTKLNDESSFKHKLDGSIAYFAPERALVKTTVTTSKSDVFSLGISAIQMASGEHPFKNVDSIFALFNAICLDPIPLNTNVSDDCQMFISKW